MFKTFISALFKKNNANHRNRKGFTVIELIVVIAIIVTISAIVLADYRSGGKQLALQRSAHKLAQDIRRIQEMAMSSRIEGACLPGFMGGYGVRFSRLPSQYPGPRRYVLFADCNNNNGYDSGIDEIIEEVDFELEARVHRIQYFSTTANDWHPIGVGESTIDIIFFPPDPGRSAFTGDSDYDEAPAHRIMLRLNGQLKYIYINNAGLIYVEQN